jgi:hypothetical protein
MVLSRGSFGLRAASFEPEPRTDVAPSGGVGLDVQEKPLLGGCDIRG